MIELTLFYINLFIIAAPITYKNMIQNNPKISNSATEWIFSDLIAEPVKGVTVYGNPEIIEYGKNKAVAFNGSGDAVFLEDMPLSGLEQFTIEMIFKPFSGGDFEQRFLHCGEVNGDRLLLELRSVPGGWYFDAFIKIGDQGTTLIEPKLLHPSDEWYHIAYVIDRGHLETFINRKKELDGTVAFSPLKSGMTSVGVRQNKVSWFRGAIYKIRITPKALKPEKFMHL